MPFVGVILFFPYFCVHIKMENTNSDEKTNYTPVSFNI
jgi:hypothetical protein